jgi:outer membrane receptor for ferrienterochelin and colicins
MKLFYSGIVVLIFLFLSTVSFSQEGAIIVPEEDEEAESTQEEKNKSEESIKLQEIVVTGTRTERVISDSPVLTQTVSENQLRERPYLNVGEALEDAPGLYVQDDSIGGTGYLKSLSIQGMDRRRVLVLVNGNPVFGSYAGRMNLANFSVGGIERVEVVKGPSSSLYGSGAIGGVVNIITKGAGKPLDYSTSLTYRADPNWNSSLLWSHRFGISRGGTSAALNFGLDTYDGYYLQDDEGNMASTALQVGYEIGGEFEHFITSQLSLGTEGQFTIRSSQRQGLNFSSFQNLDVQRYFINPYINYSLGELAIFKLSLYATHYDHENYPTYVDYEDRIKDIEELESRPFKALKSLTGFEKGEERPGLAIQKEELERVDFMANGEKGNLLWVAGANAGQMKYETDNISGGPKERDEQSAFIQTEWLFPTKTSLIGGIRYEHSDAYGSDVSPKLAVMQKKEGIIKEDDSIALRVSVAKGYRAPDFKELYYELPSSTKGMAIIGGEFLREFAPWEPRLKPEQSIGFNLGPEYFWRSRVRIHFNLFWNELWDALSFTSFDQTSETYEKMVELFPQGSAAGNITDPTESDYTKTVTNVDRVRTYGAESYFSARFRGWHGSFSYIYTMSRDITNDVRLENKPTDILKISLSKIFILGSSLALTPGVSYTYIHGELDGEEEQPDIYRLDGYISLSFGDRFTMTLGIDNITDKKDIQYLKQLPGRIIYVTNNFSF